MAKSTRYSSHPRPVKYFAVLNVSDKAAEITCTPKIMGVSGESTVRDLWKKLDLGKLGNGITISVPAHGAVLL